MDIIFFFKKLKSLTRFVKINTQLISTENMRKYLSYCGNFKIYINKNIKYLLVICNLNKK